MQTTATEYDVHERSIHTTPELSKPEKQESILETSKTVLKHGLKAADAQINMWAYRAIQLILLVFCMIPVIVTFFAFTVYGFILLDRAFDFALLSTNNPIWFSPLIRGGVYAVLAVVGIGTLWSCIKPDADEQTSDLTESASHV